MCRLSARLRWPAVRFRSATALRFSGRLC
jgi:hypothetical protein